MPLTALITRPEDDAKPLADALAARGVATVIEPLLAIATLPAAAPELAVDLAGVQAILFTSANGVRAFAELSSRRDIGALAVGDATAAVARSAGFSAVESAGGDVKDLARLVKQRLKPEAGPLFHAAGSAVAGDLAQLLAANGFSLRRRMLYQSQASQAFSPAARTALASGGIDLVLLFSPRTAATFASLAKATAIDTSAIAALCLSPAVAAAVRDLSWRAIETAARPDLPAMLALVDRQIALRQPLPERPIPPAPISPPNMAKPEVKPVMTNSPPPSASPIPATPAPRAPVVAPRHAGIGAIFLAGLIGALIAGGGVLGVLRYAPDRLGLSLPASGGDTNAAAALTQQIADVSTRLAELQQQVSALPKLPPDLPLLADRITGLQGDVAALKSAGTAAAAPLPAKITGLPQRLADLEVRVSELKPADLAALTARLAALEQRPAAAADPAVLAQVKSDLAAFDARLKAAESAMADIAPLKQSVDQLSAANARAGSAAAAAGIALSIDELHRQITGGKPFTAALEGLAKFTASDAGLSAAIAPSLASLKTHADSGVATLAALQDSFPATAEAVLRASSASADNAAPNATFTDRVLARLASLVTIRPVGEGTQGDEPPARVARAEAHLGAGDIEGAAAELAALPAGSVADAAKPWLDRAKVRLEADGALDKLQNAAIAALAGATGAGQ